MRILFAIVLPTCFVVGLFCSAAFGAEPLVDVERYAERSRQERPAAMAAAKSELAGVRKDRRIEKAERDAEVDRLEKTIADLENPLEAYYGSADIDLRGARERVDRDIKTGKSIPGPGFTLELAHRVSEQEAVNAWASKAGNIGRLPDFFMDVMQVIDAKNAIVGHFWISGISTVGFVNGQEVNVGGFLAATGGTRTYQTAIGGSNTIMLLETPDLSTHEEKFTRRDELRTWTSKDGAHTTEAILVRTEKGSATLMKLDGKTTEVELEKVSDDDREYVRKYLSEHAKLAKRRR